MFVNSDTEVFAIVFSCHDAGPPAILRLTLEVGLFFFELSEEEDIFSLDPVELVPNLERLIGVEVTLSNRSRGGEERLGELWVEIVLDQLLIVGREADTRGLGERTRCCGGGGAEADF
ncbi:hypothetical protein OIU77_018925 [Salix suchowensis]|uniref:Uncharacterized protein n=1 Tax=Salix suchowensis TaxID=1278906 RepID=A0ABQ9CI71_9ROSI|nr:hypothetical protein OIU77_018925 [Salix suchowensis]